VVMLVHSSVSGARQWRRLMENLKDRFRLRAVNLFGYGKTPPWPADAMQSLDDQARLVEAALPPNAGEIYLVGHSFGGSVAMKTAARLAGRVGRLVLLDCAITVPDLSVHALRSSPQRRRWRVHQAIVVAQSIGAITRQQ
jgi:pimeloyl-ACP methyl ester carboxylesterase